MAKSPKRKDYLKEYKQGESGKYEYGGISYTFDGTPEERKKAYLTLTGIAVLLTASVIGSGLIDAAGMVNTFYVIVPFIGEVCALFAIWWNLSKLLMEGEKIRGYIFESVNNKVDPATLILIFFAVLGLAMSVVFQVTNGFEGKMLKCFLYLFTKALNAVLAFLMKKYYNTLKWKVL
ncbi:MAG: hypothetical protein IJH69_04475 [Firmicutes bacterium]|nr:hypothetical protein [Bacillota bacterium]